MVRPRTNRLSAVLTAASVCSFAAAGFMLRPMDTKGISVHNDYLVLAVQDNNGDTDFGGFTLRKNSNNESETLTYSQYCTSFAEVSINGTVKLFSEGKNVKKPTVESDGSVVTVQDFDGVEITQKLSFSTGNTENYDMLRIEYITENKSGADVLVSVRSIIDPTIADSENDPIVAGDTAYKTETSFTGSSIPEDWKVKNTEGKIVAYGITSDGSTAPDCFDIADWSNLFNDRFDYAPDGDISDNAVALTWSEKTLKDGDSLTYGTKYGLYSEKAGTGSNETVKNSPKTGDRGAFAFAGLGAASMTAAILFRKRRSEDNE